MACRWCWSLSLILWRFIVWWCFDSWHNCKDRFRINREKQTWNIKSKEADDLPITSLVPFDMVGFCVDLVLLCFRDGPADVTNSLSESLLSFITIHWATGSFDLLGSLADTVVLAGAFAGLTSLSWDLFTPTASFITVTFCGVDEASGTNVDGTDDGFIFVRSWPWDWAVSDVSNKRLLVPLTGNNNKTTEMKFHLTTEKVSTKLPLLCEVAIDGVALFWRWWVSVTEAAKTKQWKWLWQSKAYVTNNRNYLRAQALKHDNPHQTLSLLCIQCRFLHRPPMVSRPQYI